MATEGIIRHSVMSERELIVVSRKEVALRASATGVSSESGAPVDSLDTMLADRGVTLEPLFGQTEDRIRARTATVAAETGAQLEDLAVYYRVQATDGDLDVLASDLRTQDSIEAAYVKPRGEPPTMVAEEIEIPVNDMLPDAAEPPINTPDFSPRQGYLDAAPGGIDARYAWTVPGGRGNGVTIIDCEWGWQLTHEDLTQNLNGLVFGTNASATDHGTAVIGEIGGDRNTFGITGICPDARVGAASFVSQPSARTIRQAADRLRRGDIILLEIHRAGPRHGFQARADQRGYIAIEWWPDDFAAIQYAIARGIIVVEAAGNGRENLDDAIYDTRPPGFPTSWRNPFNAANPSSTAVVVGAGAPPPGTHNRNIHGPDRSRLDFSNYGRRVDSQGWGREVTSTGYGDLQGGSDRNEWYTDTFSGTSSASPIVVGALACIQGVRRAQGAALLTPVAAIQMLRTTGSPQQDAPGRPASQRIGNRPNLRQLIPQPQPRRWSGWENLGGFCTDGVGVSSWSANRLDTFVVGNNRRLYHKWWNGSQWSGWEDLGGQLYSAPTAVSWGQNRIDVFGVGGNHAMWHKWWNGSSWSGWENLGGFCTDGVGVSSWSANRLDTFVVGNNRRLYHKWWNGSQWSGWEDLGGQLYSAPTAVSWGQNRIDVFGVGGNHAMWHKWWNGSSWSGWENLGGFCTDGVGVSSWSANRLDTFVVGNNRRLYHKWWNGSQWSGWENLGGQLYSAPAAVSWGPNRIDTFGVGGNRAMWHKWYG